MVYEAYEQKMQKIAAVLNKIRKYRILILSICAAILAIIATLLLLQGMVLSDIESPAEPFVYGKTIAPTSKVFMGEAAYEYALADEDDWSEEMPILPGEYKVRAVSYRTFGRVSYGEEIFFTIAPAPLVVSAVPEVIYGDAYAAKGDRIAYNDTIKAFTYEVEDPEAMLSNVRIDASSVRIQNGDGKDVTSAYLITTEDREVTVLPRPITITFGSAEKIYDGMPLSCQEFSLTSGNLVGEDYLQIEGYPSLTDVKVNGVANLASAINLFSGTGEDISQKYALTTVSGTLMIQKRPITVLSGSAEKMYDGQPISCSEYEIVQGSLVENESIRVDFVTELTYAGSGANNLRMSVVKSDQKTDVTSNYLLEYQYGELTVTPRALTLKASDYSWYYDGYEHAGKSLIPLYSISGGDGLVTGDTLSCMADGTITNVGSQENTLSSIQISNKRGVDVTDCYTVTTQSGTLKVLPRIITIKAGSDSWEYDGLVHPSEKLTPAVGYGYSDGNYPADLNNIGVSDTMGERVSDGLVLDHTVAFSTGDSLVDVGSTAYRLFDVRILNGDGNDVSANYQYETLDGIISVTPRNICVAAANGWWIYDGKYHNGKALDPFCHIYHGFSSYDSDSDFALVDGHTLDLRFGGIICDVGSVTNEILELAIYNVDGKDVTYNYNVTTETGVLHVVPRPIQITAASGSWVYDGEEHYGSDLNPFYSIEAFDPLWAIAPNDGLTYSQTTDVEEYQTAFATGESILNLVTAGMIQNVGTVPHIITEVQIYGAGHRDVTFNYDLILTDGTLTVTPRPVVLKAADGSWVYDGNNHTGAELDPPYDLSALDQIVSGHSIMLFFKGYICEVGTSSSIISKAYIYDEYGTDVTYNYEITLLEGTLTVTPRPITIATPSAWWVYDGKIHSGNDLYPLYDPEKTVGLALGERFEIELRSDSVIQNVGSVVNDVQSVIIYNKEGKDVTYCYSVTWNLGNLAVAERPIHLDVIDQIWEYDGKWHYGTDIDLKRHLQPYRIIDLVAPEGFTMEMLIQESGNIQALVSGQTMSATVTGSILDLGSVDYSVKNRSIYDATGADVTKNYRFIVDNETGTLTVAKRKLPIYSMDATKVYDGTPLTREEYKNLSAYLLSNHSILLHFTGTQTEIGSSENSFEILAIVDENGNDVSMYYDLDPHFGTLTVTDEEPEVEPEPDTGNINDKTDSSGDDSVFFTFCANIDANLLFRQGSFDTYTGTGWSGRAVYQGELGFDSLMLTTYALGNTELGMSYLELQVLINSGALLPYYYSSGTLGDLTGDAVLYAYYYAFDYLKDEVELTLPTELLNAEMQYRKFVYSNYIDLPETTKSDLLKIAAEQGFLEIADRKELIRAVKEYIQNAATYTEDYAAYPADVDTAVYFLTDAKEGVCRHFATSATAMYRALGIPARYTVGFAGGAQADKWVNVMGRDAHAWVEVYLDGIGWIAVDPTGGGGGGGEGEGGEGEGGESSNKLHIKMNSRIKQYDGTPLTAEVAGYKITEGNLAPGHRLVLRFSGEITEIGSTIAEISEYYILDEQGNDVTTQYRITTESATLTVTQRTLSISSKSDTKIYDGTPLTLHEYHIMEGSLLKGHFLDINFTGTQTQIGASSNFFSVRILDEKDGYDVTHLYHVTKEYGRLTVRETAKNVIRIKPYDIKQTYTGLPITCDKFWISEGKEFLPDGCDIRLTIEGSCTEVGTGRSWIPEHSVRIFDAAGNDITDEYDLILLEGIITVTPIRIRVTAGSSSKDYDGTPLELDEVRVSFGSLLEGHWIEADLNGFIVSPGSVENEIVSIRIFDQYANDVTKCYDITLRNGTLTVR